MRNLAHASALSSTTRCHALRVRRIPKPTWSTASQSYVTTTYAYDANGNRYQQDGASTKPAKYVHRDPHVLLRRSESNDRQRLHVPNLRQRTATHSCRESAICTTAAHFHPRLLGGFFQLRVTLYTENAHCDVRRGGSRGMGLQHRPRSGMADDRSAHHKRTDEEFCLSRATLCDPATSIQYPSGRTITYASITSEGGQPSYNARDLAACTYKYGKAAACPALG